MNIKQKESVARGRIQEAMKKHSIPAVGCSFGKDSMSVLHLMRNEGITPTIIWVDSRIEYPDLYKFKKRIIDEWSLEVTRLTPQPGVTFWKIVEDHGWPLFSRFNKAARACCYHLQKRPTEIYLQRNHHDILFDGLTAAESRIRRLMFHRYGYYRYVKRWKIWKCSPIWDWTMEDVWEYHALHNIPHCKIYDMKFPPEDKDNYHARTGCWACTIPIRYGHLKWLRMFYPKLWKFLMYDKGLGEEIIRLKLGEGGIGDLAKDYLDSRPCFFDKV